MNIFDEAKNEIKEMVGLVKYIENFDQTTTHSSLRPTKAALDKRTEAEVRYMHLLKKYT